mmetsp:Transcript_130367/g.226545  ORF Transcript_130367/g.226545 Transcript_130367/m.226545 type:complete len:210 (+) Transcript_130367:472-1101(+)
MSVNLKPRQNSMRKALLDTQPSITVGTTTSTPAASNPARTSFKLLASCPKSSSLTMSLAQSSNIDLAPSQLSPPSQQQKRIIFFSAAKSASISCSTLACCSLTATSCCVPSDLSTARCTCAMLADAMGVSSNFEKSSSIGFPNSASKIARTCASLSAGALSVSFFSCSWSLIGTPTDTFAAHWPTFTNSPPKAKKRSTRKGATTLSARS